MKRISVQVLAGNVFINFGKEEIDFSIEDIQMVGECCGAPGQFKADHFFSFLIKGQVHPINIPASGEGVIDSIMYLKKELKGMQLPALFGETEFHSHVLFPVRLKGESFYQAVMSKEPLVNLPVIRNLVKIKRLVLFINPDLVPGVFQEDGKSFEESPLVMAS